MQKILQADMSGYGLQYFFKYIVHNIARIAHRDIKP